MNEPYWFQQLAIERLYEYFSKATGNPLIALPTGTGKSYVIALFIKSVLDQWPNQRILCATHVKTLIQQNYDELTALWTLAPSGVCSAGLSSFDTTLPIIFGGVQSLVNRIGSLGHRDLLIIDEAHLLGNKSESSYQKLIAGLTETNPYLKVIGLSATCWRLGQGHLTDDGIFTDVALDMTSKDNFNLLLEQGYLLPPVPPTHEVTQIDLSKVKIDGYHYNAVQLDAASNQDSINKACCNEICEIFKDRKSWLIFTASIDHAENINKLLLEAGIDSNVVHSKKGTEHNDATIQLWKDGKIRCLVNKEMLTTGVNNPACDAIGCLRGMVSSALWVQALGRGTRVCPANNKQNCLVADFAGNTKRLGPINEPRIPRKPGKGTPGTVPLRICKSCGAYNHAGARTCSGCGAEFERNTNLDISASEEEIVRGYRNYSVRNGALRMDYEAR